jgi:Ca2+/Na+ antiporter
LGDVLGTVITDATIILGIVALISPFNYDAKGLYMLAASMFLAGILVISFMKSDKSISKFEGVLLLLLYIIFLFIQVFSNNVF